jgi:flagellar hook assembly protein FlgD
VVASAGVKAGRVIAALPGGRQEAGVQTLRWNGRKQAGALVPGGLYLVRLQARAAEANAASAVGVLSLRR